MDNWYKLVSNAHVGNCPICGDDMQDLCYEVNDTNQSEDSYTCDTCAVIVTYITPHDRREYHEYNNGEIRMTLEPRVVRNIDRGIVP